MINNEIFEIFRESSSYINQIGKILGTGKSCVVRELNYRNSKKVVGRLIKRENNDKVKYDIIGGHNILKTLKILTKNIGNEKFDLIIEEKAILRDLEKLFSFYHKFYLLKLIFHPFDEKVSDNFMRFITIQIINGLEILYRNNLIYYNIEPSNILISLNLQVKFSQFKKLTKYKEEFDQNKEVEIMGIDEKYSSPEYYLNSKMSLENAKKQDLFALGVTLFFLKYGDDLINFKKDENDDEINKRRLINYLERIYGLIKSKENINPDFAKLICSLIQINPEDRPTFEKIYGNKWLNENKEKIDLYRKVFDSDEEKLIEEFQKMDFLIRKENNLEKKKMKKFTFKKNKKIIIK